MGRGKVGGGGVARRQTAVGNQHLANVKSSQFEISSCYVAGARTHQEREKTRISNTYIL